VPTAPLLAPAAALPRPQISPPPPPPPVPAPAVTLTPPPGAGVDAKVAILLPLSGRDALLGEQLLDAAMLALFDLGDDRLRLLPFDTGGNPTAAATAAAEAVAAGVRLILGPLFGAETAQVAPIARRAGINVLSFSNDQSIAGDGVFVMGFLPRQQVDRLVAYAAKQGLRRMALLAPRTDYGQAVADQFQRSLRTARSQPAKIEYYDPATGELGPALRRLTDHERRQAQLAAQRAQYEGRADEVSREALKRLADMQGFGDLGFDALLAPEGGERLRSLSPLLPLYDINQRNVRLLGTTLWDDPGFANEAALRGAWFAAPNPSARAEFEAAYERAYQRRPPRLATLAYDAVAMAAVLAQRGDRPDFGRQILTNPSGFAGSDGLFRLLPDGRNERGLAIVEIGNRERRVVDPAPESFDGTSN
jgi:ABC-type branched-subunit amino acid transport system substrate-binding protein